MKSLILLIIVFAFTRTISAQVKSSDLLSANLKGKVKRVVVYTFQSGNNQENIDTTIINQKTIDTFNTDGLYIERVTYGSNGTIIQNNIYHYINDTLTTEDQYNKGRLIFTYSYKYNNKHQLMEYDMPLSNKSKGILFRYVYNNKGETVKSDMVNTISNKLMSTDSVIYARAPQIIENHTYNYNPEISTEKRIIYFDSDKNIMKMETLDNSGKLIDQEINSYQNVDKNGNWQLEISSKSGQNKFQGNYAFKILVKREISYY